MAAFDNQQGWVPLEDSRDCSQGFCTIYCPQWCYIFFPPPPPSSLTADNDSSTTAFSPLVIAIIGVLSTAFLLVSYYTLINNYCGSFSLRRRHPNLEGSTEEEEEEEEESGGQPDRQESWHMSSLNGLDEVIISKITVCRYKRGEGIVDGTDCSVCLTEFEEEESLRLLPKCSHAFHIQCIDTWLKSHSNCPLCRANIVLPTPAAADHEQETAVAVQNSDAERNGEEEEEEEEDSDAGNEGNGIKDFEVVVIGNEDNRFPRRPSPPSSMSRVPIADASGSSAG